MKAAELALLVANPAFGRIIFEIMVYKIVGRECHTFIIFLPTSYIVIIVKKKRFEETQKDSFENWKQIEVESLSFGRLVVTNWKTSFPRWMNLKTLILI